MTLGGLALAVGILVDEATVAIENIHTHLRSGAPIARAVLDASGEVVIPRLLAMLAVVSVFVPSFFMTGVSRSLFVPLSLAVGCSMIASFLLSSSLVPVLAVWMLKADHRTTPGAGSRVDRWRGRLANARWPLPPDFVPGHTRRLPRRNDRGQQIQDSHNRYRFPRGPLSGNRAAGSAAGTPARCTRRAAGSGGCSRTARGRAPSTPTRGSPRRSA